MADADFLPSKRLSDPPARRYREGERMNATGFYFVMFALPLAIIATAFLLYWLTGRKRT